MVASEAFGIVKTGGLADVVSALPPALADHDVEARLLLPAYRGATDNLRVDHAAAIPLGSPLGDGPARLLPFVHKTLDLAGWLLDCPPLYDRAGGPYLDEAGHDHPDNHRRFGLLCRVAALVAMVEGLTGFAVDVVHAHDWQAGLVGAYLESFGGVRPPVLFTAHNLHFSGSFDPGVLPELGLPSAMQQVDGLEFWGATSFLKGGLYYADKLSTVSPTYATEIQTESGGEGLYGLLAGRGDDLHGLLNGIDATVWDPSHDGELAATYGAGPQPSDGKRACKADLQERVGLTIDASVPLVGMVGRLSWQKGVDLLLEALPSLLEHGAQLVVLGSGDGPLELALRTAAAAHPGRVAFVQGYNEGLSHRLIAGSDLLAVPSRFEPCGLTQLYAQRYGTLPVARRTGGLADTVVDADAEPRHGNGFTFGPPNAAALAEALGRGLACWADKPRWQACTAEAMALDRSWTQAVRPYVALYRALAATTRSSP